MKKVALKSQSCVPSAKHQARSVSFPCAYEVSTYIVSSRCRRLAFEPLCCSKRMERSFLPRHLPLQVKLMRKMAEIPASVPFETVTALQVNGETRSRQTAVRRIVRQPRMDGLASRTKLRKVNWIVCQVPPAYLIGNLSYQNHNRAPSTTRPSRFDVFLVLN